MASVEQNNEDWREIRKRADSIASAVFFMSGGALSLSITVILGNRSTYFNTPSIISVAEGAWYLLLAAVALFLLLKIHLVLQAFLLQFRPLFVNAHLKLLNGVGWSLGTLGFITFIAGMALLVRVATLALIG